MVTSFITEKELEAAALLYSPFWIIFFKMYSKLIETSVNEGVFNRKLYLSIKGCLALKAKMQFWEKWSLLKIKP